MSDRKATIQQILEGKKVLHLTLKAKWYEMIFSGEKKEEYRDIKYYWFKRLVFQPDKVLEYLAINKDSEDLDEDILEICTIAPFKEKWGFAHYDVVAFRHGYAEDAPMMIVELLGMEIGGARYEWSGADPDQFFFVLKLGEKLSAEPIKKAA